MECTSNHFAIHCNTSSMEEGGQQYNQAIGEFRNSLKPELEGKMLDSLSPPKSAAETVAIGVNLDSRLATMLDRKDFTKKLIQR